MFGNLTEKLGNVFTRLRNRAFLTEKDVDEAMREIRLALIEADVALPVLKDFIEKIRVKAVGQDVVRSVSPGQMVVKIVKDGLVDMLGRESVALNFAANPPVVFLMAGLQGSGKTTTSGKLALRIKQKDKKKVFLASLDVYRPAAQEQLAQLGINAGLDVLPIVVGEKPLEIAKRAIKEAKLGGYDVVVLDTAGRTHIDNDMMNELIEIKEFANPIETLLVADAMTGQSAVDLGKEFNDKIGITGIILTRVDGDARGGAALSMRAITGCPIKFLGVGEKVSDFELFDAERIAGRILGMGDVVSLVETAIEKVDHDEAEKLAKRMAEGKFNLEDMLAQMRQMKKMGSVKDILQKLPGISGFADKIEKAGVGDVMIKRQEAIILAMTKEERKNPDLIKASRKKRIADGSGTTVQDVNRLLKQYQQMTTMMKQMKKMGGGLFGGLGGMPLPNGFPGLGGGMGGGFPNGGLPGKRFF